MDRCKFNTILAFFFNKHDFVCQYVVLQVGANPDPVTEGCFADDGVIEIDGFGFFDYSYNMLQENFNARTLQGFSTQAREQMWECQYCPYRTYAKYYQYYGAFDYGDQWVRVSGKNVSQHRLEMLIVWNLYILTHVFYSR